jgi:uncharacterized protein (DUF486 family)
VIQKFQSALLTLAILVVTSAVLNFTWYDHLKDLERVTEWAAESPTVTALPAA